MYILFKITLLLILFINALDIVELFVLKEIPSYEEIQSNTIINFIIVVALTAYIFLLT